MPTIGFYYVQEMVAALIMFSVFFVVAATVVLTILLLDRASQQVVTLGRSEAWVEYYIGSLSRSKVSLRVRSRPMPCGIEENN